MFELAADQQQDLDVPEPVAIDPETRQAYILVRRENYDRFKSLLVVDDFDPDEGAGHIDDIMTDDDLKDPSLDSYQDFGRQS